MKRHDRAYYASWVLLAVFLPMVVLSSLHVHPEAEGEPCHECIEHTVHNGHITAVKASVDCPLCAFQSDVYQAGQECIPQLDQQIARVEVDCATPSPVLGFTAFMPGRAPPFTFCA